MKVAVTGSTGQLGRIIIEKLQSVMPAENIVALARSVDKARDLNVEVREFDYNKTEGLEKSLEDIDRLLLVSGNEFGKRAEQHQRVIEAAKNAGVKLLVYTSLLRTDNTSIVIADEHEITEKALISSGVPYVILRNGWYTENYTVSIADILSLGTLYGSADDGKISSASRADYAEAAAKVISSGGHEGKIYELAGDEYFTLSDFAEELSKQSAQQIPYVNLPEEEYRNALLGAGLPTDLAGFLASSHVSTSKGDLFDEGKQLSSLIGRPTTNLRQSIADALKG
ncbi:SDR family oxidoreductase [Aureibacter tunicatorum]|uniref:NAD(P)H dehydrogenase (Quinone) n=1 Tax=Aureibacter tunicatorum TaxID=866807 RepID=A0AAE3XRS9_9BACT|nr:SDR family oxidoreductase [Aureibacter tunicatorum]MDR6240765.1 NAD(P)H dehydrogenase (quinone) [Aureibacter tunicatorum]BDD06902.1 NAD(P)-dependent oxidoreductase [Aureibacter tunicatorum]